MSYHIIRSEVAGHGSQSAQGVKEHSREVDFTECLNQKLKKLLLVGVECLRLRRHHHTQQQKSHLSRSRGIRKGLMVYPALVPPSSQQGNASYLFLRAVGTVSAMLKKVHELRPALQTFLSKNGG